MIFMIFAQDMLICKAVFIMTCASVFLILYTKRFAFLDISGWHHIVYLKSIRGTAFHLFCQPGALSSILEEADLPWADDDYQPAENAENAFEEPLEPVSQQETLGLQFGCFVQGHVDLVVPYKSRRYSSRYGEIS